MKSKFTSRDTARWETRGANRVLVGKPGVKIPLGRPRGKWEENIKMDLQEVAWGGGFGLDWCPSE
jgi:hypothetical protein